MDSHLRIAEILTKALDTRYNILGFKFGLDPIFGLVPGIGSIIPFFLSFYLIWIGAQMRLPNDKIFKMVSNIVFDFLLGWIPVIGNIGDFIYKANSKNLAIIKEHYSTKVIEGEVVK